MQKVARTLIAGLLVSLPSWAQNIYPPANSTINQMRPAIGCDWGGGARNLRLFIDGREWTQEANKNGGRIDINPIFDVGYGSHTVESRATSILGLPISKVWTFTIANPNGNGNTNPVNTNNPATRTYPLADNEVNDVRPRISADFPENLNRARAFLDGQEVTPNINGNSAFFQPQNDLSRGNHQVSIEATYLSGARVTQNWAFRVRPNNNQGNNNNNNNNGNGQFTNYSPVQNGQVNNSRPLVSADFGVVMDNLRFYVDKNEVTNQAQITNTRIAWNPTFDLTPGTHYVRIEGRQTNNNQFVSADWQFNVNSQNNGGNWNNGNGNNNNNNGNWNNGNNNNPSNDPIDFGVDSPNQGDRVNGSFRVLGSASPDANVRVSVKPLPNKNKVAQFTGKADANGNYNVTVTPTWATRGMRLEVTTTVVDRRGRALADPIVIQVIRR